MKRKTWPVVFLGLLFLLLGACGTATQSQGDTAEPVIAQREKIPAAEPDLRETGELVIWTIKPYTDKAVELYQQLYPEIAVRTREFTNFDEYYMALYQEIQAEDAPDLLFLYPREFTQKDYGKNEAYGDIQQLMDSGKLLDLTPVMEEDERFDSALLQAPAMEACRYRGGQYVFPWSLEYTGAMLYAQESMESVGFQPESITDTSTLIEELCRIRPEAQKNGNFTSMLGVPSDSKLEWLFRQSQIQLVDDETDTVLPEPEALQTFCQQVKKLLYDGESEPNNGEGFYADAPSAVRDGSVFLLNTGEEALHWSAIRTFDQPVGFTAKNAKGQTGAGLDLVLAIGSQGTNQANAWNFIKMIFEEEWSEAKLTAASPLKKASETEKEYRVSKADFAAQMMCGFGAPLSAEEEAAVQSLFEGCESCQLYSKERYRLFKNSMTPYFEGEKEYDACAADLRQALKSSLEEN